MQEIQAQYDAIQKLFNAGKTDEIINYYTEDCKIMAPEFEIFCGRTGKIVGIPEDIGV